MKDLLSFYRGKRVFVTGHTGFKGSWLSRLLLTAGAEVTGYSLAPEEEPNLFDQTDLKKDLHSVIGDVRDAGHLFVAMKEARPEIVFHLAAQPIVRTSYEEPVRTYETNVLGTLYLLEAVRKTDPVTSVVNVTTDKVYRNLEIEEGYTEDAELDGYDPYSNSKSCSELVTASYRRSFFYEDRSPAVSTARAGNVIGGGDYAKDRLIPDCVRAATEGRPVILRNPSAVRPFQHVLEPLFAYLLIAKKQTEDRAFAGSYNVGPAFSDCVTAKELAELFCSEYGEGMRVEVKGDSGPHEANLLRLNCTKITETLGWQRVWTIRDAIQKTVAFTKAVANGQRPDDVMEEQIREYQQAAP